MSSTGWPNNLTFVDDFDSRIQYSAGWQVVTGGAEVEGTKHGADKAGMTATFDFAGTFVSVVGSLGSVDVYGVPTTTYAIDGSVVDAYTAPVLAPGLFRLNQTFFDSPILEPGNHTLVITNVNGTSPNVVWLDYILFAESAPSPSSSTASSSTASTNLQPPGSSPVQSPHKSNTSAIVGGAVGGVAGLALLAGLLLWCLVRRRRARSASAALAYSGKAPSSDIMIQHFDAWAPAEPPQAPHRPTLPPAPSSYGAMPVVPAASSVVLETGSVPSRWPTQPDFTSPRPGDNSKDVVSFDSDLTAGLGAYMHEGGIDTVSTTPPPPYMR